MFARIPRLVAQTWLALRAFPFCKTKVYKNASLSGRIVKEIGRFDISVENLVIVYTLQSREECPQVNGDIRDCHVPEVRSEVTMAEVWQYSNDLIGMAKGGDQGADGSALAEVVEEFEFIENTRWTGCNVDLFDGDISRFSSRAVCGAT